MAYSVGDFLVTVRGNLPNGEVWSNTWAFSGGAGDANEDDVVTALHSFYGSLAALMTSGWTYSVATVTDLFLDQSRDAPFEAGAGSGSGDTLPTQCAIRISLSDPFGTRGGPFLCGFLASVVDSTGLLNTTEKGVIAVAVADLNDLVTAVGSCVIGIRRVAAATVEPASQARVGERFDVIRKRANDILEDYSTVPLG